jgi:hypothetical protein
VRDVVVPSLAHFSPAGRHRDLDRRAVEREIGARIWTVEPLITDERQGQTWPLWESSGQHASRVGPQAEAALVDHLT